MNKGKKNNTKKWIILGLLLLYFAVAYALMHHFKTYCVFARFLGIQCPGCGMTRALRALLRLDFMQAVKYNITVFFMPYIFLYLWFDFKHKIHNVFLMLIAVVAVANWILKIIIT